MNQNNSDFDIVIVRERMLNEEYGAHLWKNARGCKVITTPPIVMMKEEHLEQIKDKKVLIISGYYRDNMKPIIESAKSVCVFFNTSDDPDPNCGYQIMKAQEGSGFLAWTLDQLAIKDEVVHRIATYLDEYLYGYPSEESLCFQNGVYVIDKNTDIEKILTIQSLQNIEDIIKKGKEKHINNLRIAEQRLKCSVLISFRVNNETYHAQVAIGDTPIIDSCLLLAEKSKSGLGIMFRYDILNRKTLISARATKESNINAGMVMNALVKGGGSKPMGGGSMSELVFPQDFFKKFE